MPIYSCHRQKRSNIPLMQDIQINLRRWHGRLRTMEIDGDFDDQLAKASADIEAKSNPTR